MINKENIKLTCRIQALNFFKKQLDNITVEDFYSAEEYELIRKEYTEMAEMVRDKDKLMELKEKHKHDRNKNVNKYFKIDR